MKISTSIVIQELLSEQISQLEADITVYQTTFKNAPRAAETIAHISQERNKLLAAKEDFGALPCGMLDAAHLFTYSASADDISVAQAMMRTHRQASCAPVCKAAKRYDKGKIEPPIADFAYAYQVVSRKGIRCNSHWISPPELLLHHLGESVRVTAYGVYSLAGEKICDC